MENLILQAIYAPPPFPAGRGLYLCWELEGEETSANIEIIDIYYFYGVHPRRAS